MPQQYFSEAETTRSHFAKRIDLQSWSCSFRCGNLFEAWSCMPRRSDSSEKLAIVEQERDTVAVPWINGCAPGGGRAVGRPIGGRHYPWLPLSRSGFKTKNPQPPTPATDAKRRETFPGEGITGGGYVMDQLFLSSNDEILDHRHLGLVLDKLSRPPKATRLLFESVKEECHSDDLHSAGRIVLQPAVEPVSQVSYRTPDLRLPSLVRWSEVPPMPVPPAQANMRQAPAAFAVALGPAMAAVGVADGVADASGAGGGAGSEQPVASPVHPVDASTHDSTEAGKDSPTCCPRGPDSRFQFFVGDANMVPAQEKAEREIDDKDDVELFLPTFGTPSEVIDIVERGPSSGAIRDVNRTGIVWESSTMSRSTSEATTAVSVTNYSHEVGSISQEVSCILDGAIRPTPSNRDSFTQQKQAPLLEGIGTRQIGPCMVDGSLNSLSNRRKAMREMQSFLEDTTSCQEEVLRKREAILRQRDEVFLGAPMVKFPVAVKLQIGSGIGPVGPAPSIWQPATAQGDSRMLPKRPCRE
eukprot:TRINITY_DN38201_c0_g1_i1.p1 TRINITY_DN38201_c0_g1~~TRINITY_DN38201_c0_g1_i1.p1  ORF type:complete len:526 (+),score=88.30 TRINITY_DN38201_c0_g1_i1:139-1716(+)